MFKAYIDDSASQSGGDRRLVLAGYVNTVEAWRFFSDDWQDELDTKPSIDYFTMKEAWDFRGEFRGWRERDRDKKVSALAEVIERHAPWSVHCEVSIDEHDEIVAPLSPYDIRNPYHSCFLGVIGILARAHAARGIKGKIDFIFDENNAMGPEIMMLRRAIPKSLPRNARDLLGSWPHFENDKRVLPLQAADLLAWHLRRASEARYLSERRPLNDKLPGVFHAFGRINRDILLSMAKDLSAIPMNDRTRTRGGSIRRSLKMYPVRSMEIFDWCDRVDRRKERWQRFRAFVSRLLP